MSLTWSRSQLRGLSERFGIQRYESVPHCSKYAAVLGLVATVCLSHSGCTIIESDTGTTRSFGVTRVRLSEGSPDSRVPASAPLLAPSVVAAPQHMTFSSSDIAGVWTGPTSGVGFTRRTRVELPADCRIAVVARDEAQLRHFLTAIQRMNLDGANLCVDSLSRD